MLTDADARAHLDALTKPPGSLGRLEDVAARLCVIQQTLRPVTTPRRLVLFAADHGVVAEGVSAWPSDVTRLMVETMIAGKAACCVMARSSGTELRLVDVGILGEPMAERPGLRVARVRAGSRNLAREPALTSDELERAWQVGADEAHLAHADGMRVVAGGEMGIGNSTPAACLAVLLAGAEVEQAVGRGAGADDAALERKRRVVRDATAAARGLPQRDAIAALAGLEIAALAGFFAESASLGMTVVLDGFIATSAALVAEALAPGTKGRLIAAHRSAEPGHASMLTALGLWPVLDGWKLRLGEGTGALLAQPLLDAAAAVVGQMATFQQWAEGDHGQ